MYTSQKIKFITITSLISFTLSGVLTAEERHIEHAHPHPDRDHDINGHIINHPEGWEDYDVDEDGMLSEEEAQAWNNKQAQEHAASVAKENAPEEKVMSPQEEAFNDEVKEMKAHQKEYDDRASDNSADALPQIQTETEAQPQNLNTPDAKFNAEVEEMKEHQEDYDDRARE